MKIKYVLYFRELSLLIRLGLCFHINLAAIKANKLLSWVSLLELGQTSISIFIKKIAIGFNGTSVNWMLKIYYNEVEREMQSERSEE